MKTIISFLAIACAIISTSAQTIETIQLQIEDLEEAKQNLESQITEIDIRLNELYTEKHDLTISQYENGYVGFTAKGTSLYNMPIAGSNRKELAFIPANTKLLITNWERGSLKTSFGGVSGYVFSHQIKFENPDAYNALKLESQRLVREGNAPVEPWQLEEDKLKAEQAKKKQERFESLSAKYGKVSAQKIIDRKIWIGMTKEMMIDSWGNPEDINRSVGSWGVHEQCIYGETYVYIENGKVTSWQD